MCAHRGLERRAVETNAPTSPTRQRPARGADETVAPASELADSLVGVGTLLPRESRPGEAAMEQAFEHYVVAGEQGRGGLGRVLRAHDRRLGRSVALKELLSSDVDARARFLREARLTARLQHPSIVPIYEIGHRKDGAPYYAMKLIAGDAFDVVIARAASLKERLGLVPNVLAVVEAVAYAHDHRIIHRDLKPSNVILGAFGETMVIDWGLAKDLAEGQVVSGDDPPEDADAAPLSREGGRTESGVGRRLTSSGPSAFDVTLLALDDERDENGERNDAGSGRTSHGSVLGTLGYMPPEQFRGERVTEHADVFALGALLYHTVCGVAPYHGGSVEELVLRIGAGAPQPIEAREPNVPPELAAILKKAMAPDAGARYPSAKELAVDLKRFLDGELVRAHDYSRRALLLRWLSRHRRGVATATLFLVALALVGVVSFRSIIGERDRAETQRRVAEQQRAVASAERAKAEARAHEMIVVEARTSLDRDPAASVAWLKSYPETAEGFSSVVAIAANAQRLGAARHVLRHTAAVQRVAISHDGRYAASAGDGLSLRIWDIVSGKLVISLADPSRTAEIAFSPVEDVLIAGAENGAVRIVDVAAGTERFVRAHDAQVTSLAFAPDGRSFVTGGDDKAVRLWSLPAGTSRLLARHTAEVDDVAISPDGLTVASTGKDNVLRIVSLSSGVEKTHRLGAGSMDSGVVFSPDGRHLATRESDFMVRLWDLGTGESRPFRGHEAPVLMLAFSRRGDRLVSCSRDRTVRVWDVATGAAKILGGHGDAVESVQFSPDGARVVAPGEDGTVRLWDVASGDATVLHGHTMIVKRAFFTPDGRTVVSASHDGTLRVWDAVDDAQTVLRGHEHDIHDVVFSADGRHIASGSQDATLRVWDVASGTATVLKGHTAAVFRVLFLDEGRTLATASWDHSVRVWDVEKKVALRTFWHDGSVTALAATRDGKLIASASADGTARLWNVVTGESTILRGHEGQVTDVALSPGGDRVATAGDDGTVRVWSVAGGAPLQVLRGHTAKVAQVAFSPDGETIASSSFDTTVRLWSARTLEPQAVLRGHTSRVGHMAFAPDGRHLASSAADRTIRVWDVATHESVSMRGLNETTRSLVFSPDGALLASTNEDRTTRLWIPGTGALAAIHKSRATVTRAAFSPDGRRIASVGWDRMVRVWPVDPAAFLPTSPGELHAWLDRITTAEIGPSTLLGTPQAK
jgi:WD40 repeat protein/serine/threonine protein kinase